MKMISLSLRKTLAATMFAFAAIAALTRPTPVYAAQSDQECKAFDAWAGPGKINMVDFTGDDPNSPFKFRLEVNTFEPLPSDGFMGRLAHGTLTFSYPRKNNPEVPYVKGAPYPAPYVDGPAFGEKVEFQAREIACNVFEMHWKETHKGDTVTHVEDFGREQVCTNITNINRTPIPADFDPFDLNMQLNSKALFPGGSPVSSENFGFFPLCGKMSQSLPGDRIWEDKLHYLVYQAP